MRGHTVLRVMKLDVVKDRVTSPVTREVWVRFPPGSKETVAQWSERLCSLADGSRPAVCSTRRRQSESMSIKRGSRKGGLAAMAKMNVWKRLFPVRTHERAVAQKVDARSELRRTVLTCLLWEDTFYEKGNDIAKRIAALAAENKPEVVAALAREARDKMQLRHAPLFLVRELARRKGAGPLVAETLEHVIQRADELG